MTTEQIAYAATWNDQLPAMVSEDNPDVAQREAAREIILGLWEAKHAPIATVPLATSRLALKRGGLNCWYTTPCKSCGGEVPHCHKLERVANLRDCVDCLN